VAIDRIATLRNAEKLLRQGKLDQAIGEYGRVVAEDPRDWNTANLIGDLYVRAGKSDKAVEQFLQIADGLSEEGHIQKAGALYKKIVKLKPDHEHALMQAADIVGGQGLYADARAYLNTVIDLRKARGDARGVASVRIRIGGLDTEDFAARLDAARARLEIRDTRGALSDFKDIASELSDKGRPGEAVEALREAAAIEPDDPDIRERLLGIYLQSADFARALECAGTAAQFKLVASKLEEAGRGDDALNALRQAAALDPADSALRADLARTFVGRGDMAAAAEYLTVETAGDNPSLLMTVAEIRLRAGQIDEGLEIARKLLADDPEKRQELATLAWAVGEQAPEAGFRLVEITADAAVGQADWASAAAVLHEFVTRVPNYIPALMRLVEICVDGGLEATMFSAQAQLADAYIEAGSADEARFIAEDLVAREPWERANIERFRRALVLAGEADPDALIAERLSGESPFMSTDLSLSAEELPAPEPISEPELLEEAAKADEVPFITLDEDSHDQAPRRGASESKHFELSANAIDLESIFGELETPPTAHSSTESVEVDLSIVLDDIKKPGKVVAKDPKDLDSVFAGLRDEASKKTPADPAEEALRRGTELHAAGKIDDSITQLETATRAPRQRFAAASLLGRIYLARNAMPQAIEWFERAAEAPAPTPDAGQKLLYDLASALEQSGEVARALAIFLELQAEAGSYRDVPARVNRLAKAQARG